MAEENQEKRFKDYENLPPSFKLLVDFARERGIIGEKGAKSEAKETVMVKDLSHRPAVGEAG